MPQQKPVAQKGEDTVEYLPPGRGQEAVARVCSTCHDLMGVVVLRQPRDAWQAVVSKMITGGADLKDADAAVVSEYLSAVFGPEAPPLVDINKASAEELVKLPGVTPQAAKRVVDERFEFGFMATRDDVKKALRLDEAAFEKIRHYLRVVRPGG